VTSVTGLELALIPAGAALVGVALGTAGSAYLDRLRDRRAARRQQDQAIAELLTATVDLVSGVQTIRGAYQQHASWAHYVRLGGVIIAAAGLMTPEADEGWRRILPDWRRLGPGLERLLAADRELDENQRRVALDMGTILSPRSTRFYAALSVLTLGPDKEIASATRKLVPGVVPLLEVIVAKQPKYDQALRRAQDALAEFRTTAGRRYQAGHAAAG
jgi:hypothetical protein